MNIWEVAFGKEDEPHQMCCKYLVKCESQEEAEKKASEQSQHTHEGESRIIISCRPLSDLEYETMKVSFQQDEDIIFVEYVA